MCAPGSPAQEVPGQSPSLPPLSGSSRGARSGPTAWAGKIVYGPNVAPCTSEAEEPPALPGCSLPTGRRGLLPCPTLRHLDLAVRIAGSSGSPGEAAAAWSESQEMRRSWRPHCQHPQSVLLIFPVQVKGFFRNVPVALELLTLTQPPTEIPFLSPRVFPCQPSRPPSGGTTLLPRGRAFSSPFLHCRATFLCSSLAC